MAGVRQSFRLIDDRASKRLLARFVACNSLSVVFIIIDLIIFIAESTVEENSHLRPGSYIIKRLMRHVGLCPRDQALLPKLFRTIAVLSLWSMYTTRKAISYTR